MSSSKPATDERLQDLVFTRVDRDETLWVCQCGKMRPLIRTGYKNLVIRIRVDHPADYEKLKKHGNAMLLSCGASSSGALLFWKEKLFTINDWLPLIITNLVPFSMGKKDEFILYVKYCRIEARTEMKYSALLTQRSEKKVEKCLRKKIAVVFDRWCNLGAYYVIIFSLYLAKDLLAMQANVLHFHHWKMRTTS